ncbi:MAG: hypothetical protein FVQ81_07405 [Candidatus Glassbacteria bacterium]|nr:hypothetical protein [Candidatus Glassbacteria bacterium]
MNCDNILLGLSSSLVLLWFGHLLITEREKKRAFKAAQELFREAFMPEIRILSPEVESIGTHFNMFNYMSDMGNRHLTAIIKIEPFLKPSKRTTLRSKLNEYQRYIQGFPGWFDRDGFYKEEERIIQGKKRAFQAINDIVNFVEG